MSRLVELKLKDFGVEVEVVAVQPGPVVTRFELRPAPGVKVSQISGLAKDLARALSSISVRVVEVIPGKSVMGLEIPNERRELVTLGEIIKSKAYDEMASPLALALGKDIAGVPMTTDLARMPHLLIAGTTGSGKSVAINAMVLSLLYKSTADQVRLIMIDPKMLELSVYEGIPHLLAPVVTDMKQAANALRWCVAEMERRYQLMAALGVRNLAGFNRKVQEAQQSGKPINDPVIEAKFKTKEYEGVIPKLEPMPYIVVIIDELADLMMIVGKKVEELIARLAQKARASGIHLVLATQRPSVDVITGLIKANVPARIAFQVSAKVDSRTILDQGGAESLLGHGDMLYLPPGVGIPTRIHGAFVSDQEVHRVVESLRGRRPPVYVEEVLSGPQGADSRPAGRGGRGRRRGRRRREGRALRRGRAHRHGDAQGLRLRRAAAPEDRLQPRGAARGDHGGRGARGRAAAERLARDPRAGAVGRLRPCVARCPCCSAAWPGSRAGRGPSGAGTPRRSTPPRASSATSPGSGLFEGRVRADAVFLRGAGSPSRERAVLPAPAGPVPLGIPRTGAAADRLRRPRHLDVRARSAAGHDPLAGRGDGRDARDDPGAHGTWSCELFDVRRRRAGATARMVPRDPRAPMTEFRGIELGFVGDDLRTMRFTDRSAADHRDRVRRARPARQAGRPAVPVHAAHGRGCRRPALRRER